eukprot:scaffold2001_cov376-Prasinococcus_capsulatus_cf.AAC.2
MDLIPRKPRRMGGDAVQFQHLLHGFLTLESLCRSRVWYLGWLARGSWRLVRYRAIAVFALGSPHGLRQILYRREGTPCSRPLVALQEVLVKRNQALYALVGLLDLLFDYFGGLADQLALIWLHFCPHTGVIISWGLYFCTLTIIVAQVFLLLGRMISHSRVIDCWTFLGKGGIGNGLFVRLIVKLIHPLVVGL